MPSPHRLYRSAPLGLAALALALPALAQPAATPADVHVNTYSIVARDAKTGQLGVAVQSHWFQVGAMVPWAKAGVGAVATQALTNPSYGPRGLKMLAAGSSPEAALAALLARDGKRENRQVALIDARGRTAAHTGRRCLAAAGHRRGKGYVVQANLMANAKVWPAMARAYERATGPLAERLLAALRAAQRAGGDLRGAQSAALIVVAAKPSGKPWRDRQIDLRVADHKKPVEELARLLRLARAYQAATAGGRALAADKPKRAARLYAKMLQLAPKRVELRFWQAVALLEAKRGRQRQRGAALLRPLLKIERWRELLRRLPAGGILDRRTVNRLLKSTTASPR